MDSEPIKFRFASIEIISKKVAPFHGGNLDKKLLFNFGIKVETRVHAPLKYVIPFVFVEIKEGDNQESLADFTIACYFEVEDFEKVITLNNDGLYTVPIQLDSLIRPVAVSTARGIIYSELRGTYLQNTVMPVVFMKDFKIEPFSDTSIAQVNN